ncbi:hypothetical protein E2C01_100203 [Portunus trituberculatus]|uniref:Uncharacterized protein n=1 Tax=Portunus trituberculatus TaxID=210409 RepID=A0A5B7KBE7_PORTR|nr:hypothetical protein [Portunus trituberculatus]
MPVRRQPSAGEDTQVFAARRVPLTQPPHFATLGQCCGESAWPRTASQCLKEGGGGAGRGLVMCQGPVPLVGWPVWEMRTRDATHGTQK